MCVCVCVRCSLLLASSSSTSVYRFAIFVDGNNFKYLFMAKQHFNVSRFFPCNSMEICCNALASLILVYVNHSNKKENRRIKSISMFACSLATSLPIIIHTNTPKKLKHTRKVNSIFIWKSITIETCSMEQFRKSTTETLILLYWHKIRKIITKLSHSLVDKVYWFML